MGKLWDAIDNGDIETVQALLASNPAAANARDPLGVSVVRCCLHSGRLDLLDVVLDAEPQLDLFDAAALGDVATTARLLTERADVAALTGDGFTALHLAAYFDASYAAGLLLRAGADPEATADNVTAARPLHSAVAGRSIGVVTGLVAAGVDVDAPQSGGVTALMVAAQQGDDDLVDLLLACGADPACAADDGGTAADFAETADYSELAARLRGKS